ncbi:hypothetical protein CLIB1423_24S01178 [[Candida] railenensis]|uniref:Uncharacterized protein n=1 Tax=[Candida] railenensis TaxID=45579 RepID=A0A9P0QUJ4_9ASCO|nr:hypothetical protein CLIB1423_24S01178 [[Candida] railenensis]
MCEDTVPETHLLESLEQDIHSIRPPGNIRVSSCNSDKGNVNSNIEIVPAMETELEGGSAELVSCVKSNSDILLSNTKTEATNIPEEVSNKTSSNKTKNKKKKKNKKNKKKKKKKKNKMATTTTATTTSNEYTCQSPDGPLDSDSVQDKSSETSTIYSFESFDKLRVIFPIWADTSTFIDSDTNIRSIACDEELEPLYEKYERIASEKLKETVTNRNDLKNIFFNGYFPRSEEILCLQLL